MNRLMYHYPVSFLNPLAQIFFFINIVDGLAFTFFSWTAPVKGIGFATIAPHLVIPFGIILIIVSVLNVALLVTDKFYWGKAAAMLGFTTWFFAVVLYGTGGLWLALLIHPLPQVAFWAWYFFAAKRLQEE